MRVKYITRDCERTRQINLHQAFGQATHFIRFNPDHYIASATGKKESVPLSERHTELFKVLQKILIDPQSFFSAHPYLSMRYMYYDRFDTFENWNVVTEVVY